METAPWGASPITQSSTSAVITPTADPTPDMDMDSVDFPFRLTPEQVSALVSLSPEQWLQHCQNVRASHPRTQPEVDRFLSLPIEKIVEVFRTTVHNLSTSTPSPATSRTTATPTSSSSAHTATPTPIPSCPFTIPRKDRQKFLSFSEAEWLEYATHLKSTRKGSSPNMISFLNLPPEIIVASVKAQIPRH